MTDWEGGFILLVFSFLTSLKIAKIKFNNQPYGLSVLLIKIYIFSSCQATYYRRDHLHTHVLRHHPWKSFSPERLTGFKKQQEFVGATSNFVVPIDQRTSAYHHFRLNSMPTLLDSVQKKEQSLKNDINTVS